MNTLQIIAHRFVLGFASVLLAFPCSMGCRPISEGPVSPSESANAATIEVEFHDSLPDQIVVATLPDATEPLAATPAVDATPTLMAVAPDAANEPPAAPQRPLNTTFDKIKFEMEKGAAFKREMITPEIEKLNGRNIRIRGYILPTSVLAETGVRFFVLVRDNMECCFGPGAMLYDSIMVYMNPGKSTNYTTGVVTVEGKFSIEVNADDDGKAQAIYRLDADSAK